MPGIVSSMLDGMAGVSDGQVRQALRSDPEVRRVLAFPRIVYPVTQIAKDRREMLKYEKDPDVLYMFKKIAAIVGIVSASGRQGQQEELVLVEGEDGDEVMDEKVQLWLENQGDLLRQRAEEASREASSKAEPLVYDVEDWEKKPWYTRSREIAMCLQQKGFCILRGDIEDEVRRKALTEATKLQLKGAFFRPPWEVLSGLFGEVGSAHNLELSHPSNPPADEDEHLRKIDSHIAGLGGEMAGLFPGVFRMNLQGRTVGVVHISRTAEDHPNPPLTMNPEEADGYMSLFMRKKLQMICYVGPRPAILRICQITNEAQVFKVCVKPGTFIALRGDICRCQVDPGDTLGVTVHVDFLASQQSSRPQEMLPDCVPPPPVLEKWYEQTMQAIVSGNVDEESVPEDWVKLARNSFLNPDAKPLLISAMSFDLPNIMIRPSSWVRPFECTAFGGADCVTEIPDYKWDISYYYDEDPMGVEDFKMYTRHMGVLAHAPLDDVDPADFSMFSQAGSIDPRAALLSKSWTEALQKAGISRSDARGTRKKKVSEMGIFVGLSSDAGYSQFMSTEARLGGADFSQMSNTTIVSKLSFAFGGAGPSMTIDLDESSGAGAVDTAVTSSRQGRCETSLVSSINLIQHPFSMVFDCASCKVSRTGRGMVFDESSDGIVRSEGVVTLLLHLRSELEQEKLDIDIHYNSLVMGSAMISNGMSSSITATSSMVMTEVMQKALKDANVRPTMVQGVDVHAGGSILSDATELVSIRKALAAPAGKPAGVAVRGLKCLVGETGAPGALASLVRNIYSLELGAHGPSIHLHQLHRDVEGLILDDDDDAGSPAIDPRLLVELREVSDVSQHIGVNSFSSGTNVHLMIFGTKPFQQQEQQPGFPGPTPWFPITAQPIDPKTGESTTDAEAMEANYYIVGTWTGWQQMHEMHKEGPGVWSYVITMGENRSEAFQIRVDRDPDKTIHPVSHRAGPEGYVLGPSAQKVCGKLYSWHIDARPIKAGLINEEQWKKLYETDIVDFKKALNEAGLDTVMLTFHENSKPPGHEHAESISEMPTTETNGQLIGVPGDLYKVTFRLAAGGNLRQVGWCKLPQGSALPAWQPKEEEFVHVYYVFGSHNFWALTAMETMGSTHRARVRLSEPNMLFQIIRDKDYDQTVHPAAEHGTQEAPILGPDPAFLASSYSWLISGKVGDVFMIQFIKTLNPDGRDTMSIEWEAVLDDSLEQPPMAREKDQSYVVVDSDGGHFPMEYHSGRDAFVADVVIGPRRRFRFQILMNGNWLTLLHPNTERACFRDQGVEVQLDAFSQYFWHIGRRADDAVERGDRVRIALTVPEARGERRQVLWRRLGAEEAAGTGEE